MILEARKDVAAVQQRDFRGEPAEENRFLHRGIAAAHYGDLLVAEKEAVAGGAARHAVADQRLFAGQAQPARARTRGDDQRARMNFARRGMQADGMRVHFDARHQGVLIGCAEASRLLLHVLDQLRPLNALGPAGKVLDHRGNRELAAGLVTLQNQRFHPGARGVKRGRQSGAAGA